MKSTIYFFLVSFTIGCVSTKGTMTHWKKWKTVTGEIYLPKEFHKAGTSESQDLFYHQTDTILIYHTTNTVTIPRSLKEKFRVQFDIYHHQKFFELVLLDKKVHKLFLDSVDIIEITPPNEKTKTLYICHTCNAYAKILFKNHVFTFPYNIAENEWKEENNTVVSHHQQNNISWKKYFVKNKQIIQGLEIVKPGISGIQIISSSDQPWTSSVIDQWTTNMLHNK